MIDYKNRDWLYQKYIIEKLNTYQIAKLCNCNQRTIWNWLIRLNIPRRSLGEAKHLSKGNHCNLSKKARQWIDGELLGDGCLFSQSIYSANVLYSSKYKEYVQYVSDTLKSFGIKQSGKIYKRHCKFGKWDSHIYCYASLSYNELLPIRKRWYPNRKKTIPKDLELASLTCRQWYIGDGCLAHPKSKGRRQGNPYIRLSTTGFSIKDVEWLVKKLIELGFKAVRQSYHNLVGISAYSTKDFLKYIGKSPVKCYGYKWSY